MKALVTGSNGFIGSFLVEKLLDNGIEVRCLVRKTSNIEWLGNLNVEFIYGELRDPSSLYNAVRHVDVIYHLGGVTRGRQEQDYIDGNYTTTVNLLKTCIDHGPEHQKFVFVSSQAAGGPSIKGIPLTEKHAVNPVSMYGRSKKMAEQAVLQLSEKRPVTIVRPPSVYGPRDKDFYTLFKYAKSGVMPMVDGGEQQISIIYISDLVDGIYLAGTKPEADGELFFISSEEQVSFAEIAKAIMQALDKKARLVNIPIWAVELLSEASIALSCVTKKSPLMNRDKVTEIKQPAWLCSAEKAKRLLGFKANVTLERGMQKTAAWYKNHGWL